MNGALARPLVTLALVGLAVAAAGIANHELWTPDEPRVAGIGREMWQSGAWAVPRLTELPFLEKPPLFWWAQVAVFEAFGRTSAVLARLPSAVFGLATLFASYALGRAFLSREASLLGALVLASAWGFVQPTHWVIVDSALVLATTGVLACFARARTPAGWTRRGWLAGMYACVAAAFLAKGVIGVGVPALGVLVYLLWSGRLREFLGLHLLVGGAGVVAIVSLWLWRVWVDAGGDALHTFLVYNQLGRFLPSLGEYTGGHERPLTYYLVELPVDFLPWSPLAILAGLAAWRNWRTLPEDARDGLRLFVAVSLPAVVVLSLAGTKRGLYLLPVFPPLALLVGWWMAAGLAAPAWEARIAHVWAGIAIAAAAVLAATGLGAGIGLGASAGFWPWAVLGVVLFAAAAWWLARQPAPTPAASWLRPVLLVCLGWAIGLQLALVPLDPVRTMRPALDAVVRQLPDDAVLHLLEPTETTRGLVAFYTDQHAAIVEDAAGLGALATDGAPVYALIEGKRGRGDYAEFAAAGIPHRVLAQHVSGSKRELHLIVLEGGEGP